MPLKSQAQRRFMYAKHPELASEFEAATPSGEKLPDHVAKKKAAHKAARKAALNSFGGMKK